MARASEAGVAVDGLTPYRSATRPGPAGLLFGYGTVNESGIDEGVRLIADVIAGIRTDQRQSAAPGLSAVREG